ncbi:MAG TPA: GreA/GreB family elongation factor, partial [Cyclobacteriaceae bacterium]|nr:GreA/GreB family elongation factor [Cyclobacteriaceae bacterium]
KEIRYLADELKKAKVVKEDKIGADIVRLNSTVQIEDTVNNNVMDFQIVLPSQANLKEKKISILAPIGIALIGFKKNQVVEWNMPAGKKTMKIVEVVNAGNLVKENK